MRVQRKLGAAGATGVQRWLVTCYVTGGGATDIAARRVRAPLARTTRRFGAGGLGDRHADARHRQLSRLAFGSMPPTMSSGLSAPKAVVIAGPSGVGKGTLIQRLKEEYPERIGFSVSHTTRAPRAGELNGVHYNFSSHDNMRREIDADGFVEWAEVHGNLYGTSRAAVEKVLADGRVCVLDIDVQGCRSVRRVQLPARLVFIAPPSLEELERRLRGRGTEAEEKVLKRLQIARTELEAKDEAGLFDAEIVNDDLDAAYEELKRTIADELNA